MNKWMLLLSLFSAASYSDSEFLIENVDTPDYNPPQVSRQEQNNVVCESVVCNSISQSQPVPEVGEVPEREPNKTIETLASAIYITGAIYIASEGGAVDNLSEPDDEHHIVE